MDDDLERAKEAEIDAVTFSFDVSRLKEDVAFSGDTVVTVIRAHLYLEHVIMQTLAEAFKVPDVVDFRRMSFLSSSICALPSVSIPGRGARSSAE